MLETSCVIALHQGRPNTIDSVVERLFQRGGLQQSLILSKFSVPEGEELVEAAYHKCTSSSLLHPGRHHVEVSQRPELARQRCSD